nr:RNA pyrophosphohydrolase [uncultured bacterium]
MMMFSINIGLGEVQDKKLKINHREAIRAVIFKDKQLLMIKTNKGDYKFPGGGIETNEDYQKALTREVREEAGYTVNKVINKLGIVNETHLDEFEDNLIFEMVSHYYLCEVTDNCGEQELDDYELEQEFCPEWISIGDAISNNEKLMKDLSRNRWVERETRVLHQLCTSLQGGI